MFQRSLWSAESELDSATPDGLQFGRSPPLAPHLTDSAYLVPAHQ